MTPKRRAEINELVEECRRDVEAHDASILDLALIDCEAALTEAEERIKKLTPEDKPLTACDYGTCGHFECHHGGDGR